jgi:hypothetical protein
LAAAMSVVMLSSCSVVYSGVYKSEDGNVTVELGLYQKAVITTKIASVSNTEEYIYKIDSKKKLVILYNKDDKDKEVGTIEIVSRDELKYKILIVDVTLKRDSFLPSFSF